MEKKLIIANWKMQPQSLAEAQEILNSANEHLESLQERKELSLVFCPPFIFLEDVSRILRTSHLEHEAFLGAQDISTEDSGAMTGEVSGPMLKKAFVDYVIIGHSERRWKMGEPDELVNKKLKASLRNELIPVVCIGEKSREGNFKKFIEDQVVATFTGLSADEVSRCIVAYEPVWAISTNPGAHSDTPESALESINIIKSTLSVNFELKTENLPSVLYGGSINSKNAGVFLALDQIKGILVGGASINKEEFGKILNIATHPSKFI